MRRPWITAAIVLLAGFAGGLGVPAPLLAAEGKRVQITGEVMDTWCYLSGVMGGPEAVVGSAHHTCALWCAAGGIPVGVLADDGTVYFVLVMEDSTDVVGTDTMLELQSDRITADGVAYERDGNNFLVVEKIVANAGITNLNHEDFGPVPGFAIPGLN